MEHFANVAKLFRILYLARVVPSTLLEQWLLLLTLQQSLLQALQPALAVVELRPLC